MKVGNSCQFKLDVVNETEHDIVLGKRTCLGRLELVRSVTPMDVHFKPFPGKTKRIRMKKVDLIRNSLTV